jgi:hypothetical protein
MKSPRQTTGRLRAVLRERQRLHVFGSAGYKNVCIILIDGVLVKENVFRPD